ncbi:MAG TPA: TIGR02996 domain-containing protein [Enhygromyxa sp.]|nr:TIGR02996 domain-containing protein [Enhygromyxa sp.]
MPPTLAELRARPDDRELLLVYADWLESQGHPRGELIAVQDAEAHCETIEEFERARTRASELIESSVELAPELPAFEGGSQRKLWALWQRGFVRRLELLIDQPAPSPGLGLRGWSELLARLLEHPSLALLEELLIRVDLRGEPLDEAEAALAIVTGGLARWHGTPLLLALWTSRPPRSDQRDRYRMALPGVRTLWYSTDITRILPPSGSPISALEGELVRKGTGLEGLDLAWIDSRGLFREVFEAVVIERQLHSSGDPSLAVHVRHMAERRRPPMLACHDPVAQRRIEGVLDNLAARFHGSAVAQPLAPRRLGPRPEPLALATACERLGDDGTIERALAGITNLDWWWFADGSDGLIWLGLCGLGSEQLLTVAMLMAVGGPITA